MNSTKNKTGLRRLNIDFDQFPDADTEFQQELVSLMIADLRELHQCMSDAARLHDPELFLKGIHKANTTVRMINDAELIERLEQLKTDVEKNNMNKGLIFINAILCFDELFGELLNALAFQDNLIN
jgi:hypothetical protein